MAISNHEIFMQYGETQILVTRDILKKLPDKNVSGPTVKCSGGKQP
jgi:hypothetical protein